jgi:hypothetical protein
MLDNIIRVRYTAIMMIEADNERGKHMDNLIDWKLELTLQERLTRRQAMAYFIDEAPLTLAVALAPWIALLWLMH